MIERVEIKNWKSHHETELEFDQGVNALIGTMGSGKSSVLEAIVFGFFGTTPSHNSRDVKLDDLIRRSPSPAEKAEIELEFSIGGENYSVRREIERGKGTTRSELRKEGDLIEAPSTTEVTEQVEKLLGLGFKSFTRAIYSEQNNLDLFLDMTPGDRKEKLDQLLEIDRFENARKTMVRVENNLEKELERYQEELSGMEEEIDEEKIEELEEEIDERKEKLEKLEEEMEETEKKLEELNEEKQEMEQKKEKIESLEERKTRLETKQESVQERIDEIEQKLDGVENPKKRLEEARKQREELQEKKEKIGKIEEKKKYLEKDREQLEEEISLLEEQVEKYSKLDKIEDQLGELQKQIEDIKQKGNSLYAEREQLEESIETLEETDGNCPTCGQEMDEKHREQVIEERKEKIKDLKRQEKKLRQELEEKNEKREKLEDEKERLLEFRSAEDKLEKKQEERREKDEKLEDLEKELEELNQSFSEDKMEELEQRIEKLESFEDMEELEEKEEHLEEKLEEVREQLKEIDFEEENIGKLREEISELKEQNSARNQKKESEKELLEEKSKRLEQLRKQVDKKQELEEKVEKLDRVIDYAFEYRSGLEKTQVELRRIFVEKLNQKMDSIWSQVYPYDDYYSIRLNAENDYLVEVLDSENNWVSADAEVSGGERHSAALVMRLALTFALAPKLQVLMLDEPTHNMDSSAVEELAETLRQNSSDLIEQLFMVTHDPALESAATGKLYRLDKKNTENGLTQVEQIQ